MIKSLYILNRSGSLLYQRDFGETLNKLDENDYLVLAGTLHSVHALASQISPVIGSSGIRTIETPSFCMYIFQSMTGVKLLLVTDRTRYGIDAALSKIHVLYSDYVVKNPFYSLEMPIRCEKFDRKLQEYVASI